MAIDYMKYFFRTSNDPVNFKKFGIIHILLIIITLLMGYFIVKNRKKIDKSRFEFFAGLTFLIQATLMYGWYYFGDYKVLEFGLPFYTCRIAIIIFIINFLFKRNLLWSIAIYWGFYGSILSFVSPDFDGFSFPHYTYISYFVGHILLYWSCLYLLFVKDYDLSSRDLTKGIVFSILFNIVLYIFDSIFNVNYNYLIQAPIFTDFFSKLNPLLYFVILQFFFTLIFLLEHLFIKKLKKSVN